MLLLSGLVHIFDRHGQQIDELGLDHSGRFLQLDWDVDGEVRVVAVSCVGSQLLTLEGRPRLVP